MKLSFIEQRICLLQIEITKKVSTLLKNLTLDIFRYNWIRSLLSSNVNNVNVINNNPFQPNFSKTVRCVDRAARFTDPGV